MFDEINREITIIEVRINGVIVGKFVDTSTIIRVLGQPTGNISYSYYKVNEKHHEKVFWDIIRKGYVIEKPELIKKATLNQKTR